MPIWRDWAHHGPVRLASPPEPRLKARRPLGVGIMHRRRVIFLLLGRRGAMPRLGLQVARAAMRRADLEVAFVVSRGNDLIEHFSCLGPRLLAIDTIDAKAPIRSMRNYSHACRLLGELIRSFRPDQVVNLCPHLWTPLLALRVKQAGIPFATVVHDATGHPGELRGWLAPWFRAEAREADEIITLSRFVARELVRLQAAPATRIRSLFLPDLHYGPGANLRVRSARAPLKLLFFGRILKYRGLGLLLDALDLLRLRGVDIQLTVAGAGKIGRAVAARLSDHRARVENAWISEDEMGRLLARHDAVVACHVECSQSGIVAAALGSGVPVVGLPIGGLSEQVIDGCTGVLARAPDAVALADAIQRLAEDEHLYQSIRSHLRVSAGERSTERFLSLLLPKRQEVHEFAATPVI